MADFRCTSTPTGMVESKARVESLKMYLNNSADPLAKAEDQTILEIARQIKSLDISV